MSKQTTSTLLMVKPYGFDYNTETAEDNHFQTGGTALSSSEITRQALLEFQGFVSQLKAHGIEVIVFDNLITKETPDAVFPNNWFSTHMDGTVYLYPMFANNRRTERRQEVLDLLTQEHGFSIDRIMDWSKHEDLGLFLEGTGSMILDRPNKIIYAALSERTSEELLKQYAQEIDYELVAFSSYHNAEQKEVLIYHTNVMLCVAQDYAVVCLESITNLTERKTVIESLKKTNKAIVELSLDQIDHFAGNMLEAKNKANESFLIMSSRAYKAINQAQIIQIQRYSQIIHAPLTTIENYGGGSARCMLAEIFLPRQEK
ncbi:MAG: amidinotransferase [Crocinitomicaceae bacterium]|nr:amidinotransferase [Crocinitomicaceae bacterium]